MNLEQMDREAFGSLVERHRRELQAHSYRMMGSIEDAEDMVQETLLKAWRRRETFEARASLRAWLYKICTHVCLDALKKRPRRFVPATRAAVSSLADPIPPEISEPIWLEPYPDHLLAWDEDNPEEQVARREYITLAFVAALHRLPPRQRAALILCDVLDFRASEAAAALETSVSALKSVLHRARSTMAAHTVRPEVVSAPDAALLPRLRAYVQAWEQADADGLASLLKEDATFSMPPIPSWYQGKDTIRALTARTVFAGQARGRWRLLPTRANHQPAFALYRRESVEGTYAAYGIQVLTFEGSLLAAVITFRSPALVSGFGLPSERSDGTISAVENLSPGVRQLS